jgi:hypothetical protein
MIGRTIGKYRFVGQLGRGASGVVYQAVDETLNRDVAVKILHPDLTDTEIMRRFRAEATTLAQLNHPGITTIYELLPDENGLLMVMELVRGETLEALSNRVGAMPVDRAASLTDMILSALEYAHRAGIVHRDIKPANVMVTDSGVKIMDFGIARVRGAEQLTLDGSMIGTPAYMSPEQVLGQDVNERADLYSVGVVLYRLLTGALPFRADTPVAMLHVKMSEAPMPLRAHRADLPDWWESVLERALAKSPSERFQTAHEFREAIGRGAGTTPLTVGVSAHASTGRALPLTPRNAAKAFRLTRRSAITLGVASMAALALLVVRGPVMELTDAETLPPITFKTKALIGAPGRLRERDAQLVLADGMIALTDGNGASEPLRSVAYDDVTSISYSRGRDPMWSSPDGPAQVTRVDGGALAKLGIIVERHWIALETDTDEGFLVLRVGEEMVTKVLAALEERTGRTPQHVKP